MFPEYDAIIKQFRKEQKWTELLAYCEKIRKKLQAVAPDDDITSDDKHRWLVQVLHDMLIAYTILDMPDRAVAMAKKILSAQRRTTCDPLDLHFAYQRLANTLQAADRLSEAKRAYLRSITCLLTPNQIEFLAGGLGGLGTLRNGEEALNPGEVLQELARDLRHERKWASANPKSEFPSKATDTTSDDCLP